jgi:hypothetical protein
MERAGLLDELRAGVARLERRGGAARGTVLAFGVDAIDAALPGGGLA